MAIASAMLGICVSTFVRHEGQVFSFIPLIVVPSVFLSGLHIDVKDIPRWVEELGIVSPLHHATSVIQEKIEANGDLDVVWVNLVVLSGCSVMVLLMVSRILSEVE